MEDERIKAVKQWLEPKSIRDIQIFLRFANFYRQFIQGFSRIAAPLTSLLKTTKSTGFAANPKETKGEVGGISVDGNSMVDGGEATNLTKEKNQAKTTKSKILVKSKSHDFPPNFRNKKAGTGFLTPEARLAFTQLRQAFVEAPILHHFDPESHIRIETDASGYAIGGVLSQLSSRARPDGVVTKDDLGQWHLVAFFSRKMIPAETRYKTHDGKFLAIVEIFKTWRHYLKGCKYEVLILTNYNNFRCFIDIKSLSSRQVRWTQELFYYHFCIDYRQGKANEATDTLLQYPHQNAKEKATLWAKNTKILHQLQSSLANVSGFFLDVSSPRHQIFFCNTAILPQLRRFWDFFQSEIANKGPYNVIIGAMRLRLPDLQSNNNQVRKMRAADFPKRWEDIKRVLQYGGLPYIPEIIWSKLISWHHDDPLAGYFGIDKTRELITKKYYWPTLRWDVEAYVKSCDVFLASMAVCHKPYRNLQTLPVPTHKKKDLFMDFVTGLSILTD